MNFREHLALELKDPEFAAEWERSRVDRALQKAVVGARIERGLTQRELAKALGVSQPVIARIESGTHSPRLDTIQRIADVLGVTFDLHIQPKTDPTVVVGKLAS